MTIMQWILELFLIGLLVGTMFHALRLERALGVLKRDRAALEELVAGFNASTRAAEQGVERLREAADGAGRQISRQVDIALRLKDDLVFLTERAEAQADRLDRAVRVGRGLPEHGRELARDGAEPQHSPRRTSILATVADRVTELRPVPVEDAGSRVRSQAERDLIRALKMVR